MLITLEKLTEQVYIAKYIILVHIIPFPVMDAEHIYIQKLESVERIIVLVEIHTWANATINK